VVAYRLIGILWGEGLWYIIKADRQLLKVRIRQAIGYVSHLVWTQGRVCVRCIESLAQDRSIHRLVGVVRIYT
jgi:hypothetical protein